MSKWISKEMHADKVQDFLNSYEFIKSTLILTRLQYSFILVTFYAIKKKETEL